MAKKERKNINPNTIKYSFVNKIINNKNFIYPAIIFFFIFLFSFFTIYYSGKLDLYRKGTDASFYVQIGLSYTKIFKEFFHFLGGFISGSFTTADYQKYGFIDTSPFSTIFRSPFYGFYLGIIISLLGLSNISMLISQSFLNGLLFVLVYLIVKKVKNKKTALISLLLLIFHVSVFTVMNVAQSETFLTVFILLFIYIMLTALEKLKKIYFFLSGIIISLIALIKPSMQYYFLIVIIGLIILFLKKDISIKSKKKYIFSFIKGFLIILVVWVFIFYRTTGRVDITSRGLEGPNLLLGCAVPFKGQTINAFLHTEEFREEVKDLKQIPPNWYPFYSGIALKASIKYILHNPINFFLTAIEKGICLFESPPANYIFRKIFYDYRNMVLPYYHKLLSIMFILYLVFSRKLPHLRILISTIFIYLIGLHSAGAMDTRYLLPLVPFSAILSSLFIFDVNIKKIIKFIINKKNYLFFIIAFNGILIFLTTPYILNYIFYRYYTMRIIQFLIRLVLFGIDSIILFDFIKNHYTKLEKVIIGVFLFIIIFIYNSLDLTNPTWGYWKGKLNSKNEIIQKIVLPDNFDFRKYDQAYIIINLFYKDKAPGFNIIFNNSQIANTLSLTNISPITYQKNEKWKPNESQWAFIPININALKNTNFIKLNNLDEDYIVWGNYSKKRNMVLPSFIYHQLSKAFLHQFKYSDSRIHQKLDLLSKKNISSVGENNKKVKDFSRAPFLQTGRYHIFLLLKNKGDYFIHKRYTKLDQAHSKYLGLLSLVDRGIIKWYERKPSEDHMVIRGNLITSVISEVDRFYSGYELY